ncbi:MAG: ABC transporter ATP-binding protein [Gammaproteobacteria bacterium]|nr:ABC transporter ATP-binding protein [Gammaproteobacteria bacterium]
MFKLIKQLFSLLSPSQRRRFFGLQVLVVLTAFAEVLGVASMAPFMAIVGDMSILSGNGLLAELYIKSGMSSPDEFVFWLGVSVLVLLLFAALISMYTTWRLSMFATSIGSEIADTLYQFYMNQSWLFHSASSSAQLTKQVANETTRLTTLVLQPLMQMNARIVLAFFMSLGIFIYNPMVAIIGLLIFSVAYALLYKVVKYQLHNNGEIISNIHEVRFRLMNEGFGGIKDVLLLGRSSDFINRFEDSGKQLAYSLGTNNALAHVPRYLMELVAFGAMIGLVLYLLLTYEGDLGVILPVLSVYALAGFKLLPAFQQIYFSLALIKGNISAFTSIKEDLENAKIMNKNDLLGSFNTEDKLPLFDSIKLKNIKFTYPNKTDAALNSLTLSIPANKVVGIVGSSGSGKSTAIDVLLGLIEPQAGQVLIDNTKIESINRRAWQNTIGFVPQSIFLSEGTIAENVAFGVPEKDINLSQVKVAIKLAHLEELISELPDGINTKVGERGVQLSGGQRQRIGIARALYHEASVLVFDEATSALDGITEKVIMDAIHDFNGQKTIVMIAHRLKTVQKCDIIFFIDKGKVIDQGTYQELIEKNTQFKKMAAHA